MTPSKTRAHQISQRVLDALQEADEIGGPEREDYISMMRNLARVCLVRAAKAEEMAPEQEIMRWARRNIHLNATIENTGGGCTALRIPAIGGDGNYWWITDDLCAPSNMVAGDEPFVLGLYTSDGIDRVMFKVSGMQAAANIINAQAT